MITQPEPSGKPGAGHQRDHHLKTDGILTITGNANNTLTITTPSGRTYPSSPALYADPGPPPF